MAPGKKISRYKLSKTESPNHQQIYRVRSRKQAYSVHTKSHSQRRLCFASRPGESQFPLEFRVKRRAEPARLSRVFLGAGAVSFQIECQRQIVVDATVAGLNPERRPELRYCQAPRTRLEIQGAQIEARLRQPGIETNRALEMGPLARSTRSAPMYSAPSARCASAFSSFSRKARLREISCLLAASPLCICAIPKSTQA